MTIVSVTQNPKSDIKHPQWKPGGKGGVPLHVTQAGTCKYQCNGPTTWGPIFRSIADKVGGPGTAVGVGIRAVLASVMQDPAAIERLIGKAKGGAPLRAIDLAASKAKKPAAKKPAAKKPAAKKPAKAKAPAAEPAK